MGGGGTGLTVDKDGVPSGRLELEGELGTETNRGENWAQGDGKRTRGCWYRGAGRCVCL